ncbi:MAG: hypothetical protein ACKO5Z_08310 [Burkholderiaceae bacterium]
MKFLDIFSKQAPDSIKNVRSTGAPTVAERQATSRKIDAIESEISAELDRHDVASIDSSLAGHIEQHIAEASILYAHHQSESASALLLHALTHAADQPTDQSAEATAWQMLLEIASFTDDQTQFEAWALRYAERFEASPPQWHANHHKTLSTTAAAPMLAFRGKLLGSSSPALTQLSQAAPTLSQLTLDLRSVTEIDIAGCSALLILLSSWHRAGKKVRIEHAVGLQDLLRTTVQQGRHDDDDAARRLLIELLRISGDEVGYEDACIAYCLTYELSPPAPLGLVVSAAAPVPDLLLPEQIRYPVDDLLERLRAGTKTLDVIVLNGRQLRLIEFNAAAPLLAGVADLAQGKTVEWRAMPHLASMLLQLISGDRKLQISHRMF